MLLDFLAIPTCLQALFIHSGRLDHDDRFIRNAIIMHAGIFCCLPVGGTAK